MRDEEKLFTVEGDKLVKEFLMSELTVDILAGEPEYLASLPDKIKKKAGEIIPVSYSELKRISSLKTPHDALAVVKMRDVSYSDKEILDSVSVMLDTIQDPGNLGTIIRAAAWFGIRNIFCSVDCADMYNPKVLQATMGAILRVNVFYCDLAEKLRGIQGKVRFPVFGAMLEGESIYSHKLDSKGIILIGNESRGISPGLFPYITCRLMIPRFTDAGIGIDSLNAGMAASIVFSEFARRKKKC